MRFDAATVSRSTACKVCGGATSDFGRRVLLGRHEARYRRCDACGFLFVVDPTWLDEAYTTAISDIDIGPVERMNTYSLRVKIVLHYFLDRRGTCLDYGGGYGLLVRRMRDLGYDFRWHDKYCENLFAKDFVGSLDAHYELLTAFEVLEHLTDPLDELDRFARTADNVFASTLLIGATPPPLADWHYYAPETGQHIGFFTIESMRRIAARLGLHYATDGVELHLFSKKRVDPRLFRHAMKRRVARVLNAFVAPPSLLSRDFTDGRRAALARFATIEAQTAAGKAPERPAAPVDAVRRESTDVV